MGGLPVLPNYFNVIYVCLVLILGKALTHQMTCCTSNYSSIYMKYIKYSLRLEKIYYYQGHNHLSDIDTNTCLATFISYLGIGCLRFDEKRKKNCWLPFSKMHFCACF